MIHHHPDEALLLAYAGGAADEAVSLIVATHMAYCQSCRARATQLEALGGSLLQDLPPAPMSGDALQSVLTKLDEIKPVECPVRPVSCDGTPGVLRNYIGGDLRDVRWRRMGPNLSYVPL
ncbi:MAG TPA: hypothetical protein VEV64_05505, partial [Rhizomicrobium sp.]|nr:hypothetical protein [Rhizomicrobium sp.]